MQAGERNALRVRHLDDARRDGLRFLAEADDERDAAALAVLVRGAQQMPEVRVGDVGDLRGVERIAEAQPVEIFLDAGGERVDVRALVARVAEAKAEAPGVRQAPAGLGRDAPARQVDGVGREIGRNAVGPVVVQPVGIAEQQLLVARIEALFEMQAREEMPRRAEAMVEADRGAFPRVAAAGEILVADVGREPIAALEQAPLIERGLAFERPGGLRELRGGLREQRVGRVEFVELVERRGVEAPDVFVGGREGAAFFEVRQRLARAPQRDQRLGLAEQPVDIVRVVREEQVVLRERIARPSRPRTGACKRVARIRVVRLRGDRRLQRRVAGQRRRRRQQPTKRGRSPFEKGRPV